MIKYLSIRWVSDLRKQAIVLHLAVQLENKQRVYFNSQNATDMPVDCECRQALKPALQTTAKIYNEVLLIIKYKSLLIDHELQRKQQ